jgi:hypothetical protein
MGPTPADIVTDPDEFPETTDFSDSTSLVGMGRWVTVNQDRFWVPYTYQDEWEPYQNGYWAWNDSSGWNWVSYDPWGWYTDHYGVWRHHAVYGWMWLPFEKRQYVPCTVTWIYHDNYIGWYPYYSGYRRAYRHGYEHGFDDGYWAGVNAATWYASPTSRYHHGFTIINPKIFGTGNIYGVNRIRFADSHRYIDFAWKNRLF